MIVAGPANECIAAGTAVQDIIATIAYEHIVEAIPCSGSVEIPSRGQILDVRREGIRDMALNRVDPLIHAFNDRIPRIIDHKGVIPRPTSHGVDWSADDAWGYGRVVPDGA